jgi:hypothetical protein
MLPGMETTSMPLSDHSTIDRAAFVRPASANEEDRTIDLVIASENPVGGYVLRCAPDAVQLGEAPVPVMLDHTSTVDRMAGRLTGLRFDGGQLIGRAQFKDAPGAEMGWQLARSGCAVSVRALFSAQDVVSLNADADLVRSWRLGHAALVPEGADSVCLTRSSDSTPMTLDNAGVDPVQAAAPEAVEAAAPAPAAEAVERAAVAAPATDVLELKRELEIRRACGEARLPVETVDRLLSETKGERDSVRWVMAVVREQRLAQEKTSVAGHPAQIPVLSVQRDAGDKTLVGIERAVSYLASRTNPSKADEAPADEAREWINCSMQEIAREMLQLRGVNTRGMTINQLVDRSFHSTSDFSNLMLNVAQKTLIDGYAEEPRTWLPLAQREDRPDFKEATEVDFTGRMIPEELKEGGEYKARTLVDGKRTWSISSYGQKVTVSRKLIINDDLGALTRVPLILGAGFNLLESNMVWGLLTTGSVTSNQTYGGGGTVGIDGLALFAQTHKNTGSGAIGITGFDAARQAIRDQKDAAGNRLSLQPAFLIVPHQLETTGIQFLFPQGPGGNYAPTNLTGANATNPFAGSVQLIVEPRLGDNSAALWYMASRPTPLVGLVKYGYLRGESGPTITTTEKRDPDGLELLARFDFGVTLPHYAGFYRSTGV